MTEPFRYPLATSTWDEKEIEAIHAVVESGRFTMGPKVEAFEKAFAEYFGAKYAVMVNSGSSANLLAVASLIYHSRKVLRPGDEVLVPAISWSTTYYPLLQYGLRTRFVDIDSNTLNIDFNSLDNAVTEDTRAVFAVNLLGNPNDFHRLSRFCSEHDMILIEDNCESMGAKFSGQYAGTFGLCGTFSMYFSHHICTMEGGVLLTDDEEINQITRSLRAHGWTRELPKHNRFLEGEVDSFTEMFHFILPGYNLRPLEVSGAIGLTQLEKLDGFIEARRRNARRFQELFKDLDFVSIQEETGDSTWFGFALILKGGLQGRRAEVAQHLKDSGIECRPVVAGNFTRQPVIKYIPHSIAGPLTNANKVDSEALFVGNHHYDISKELEYLREKLIQLI